MSFPFHLRQLGKFLGPKRRGTIGRRPTSHRLRVRALEKRDLMSVVFYPRFGNESAAYQSGQRLVDPPVYLIYWGSYWTHNPTATPTQVDQAAASFLSGPYLTGLSQYGGGIGDAWFAGSAVDTLDPDPTNGFSMTYLEGIVNSAINNLGLPNPGATQYLPIYMVVTPPGIVSDQADAGGYHTVGVSSSLQELVYGWIGSDGSLPSITTVLSHEVVESISDPLVSGWPLGGITVTPGVNYTGIPGNELADNEAQNYTAILNGVTVQSYWSQQDEEFVVPDGTQGLYVYNGISLYI